MGKKTFHFPTSKLWPGEQELTTRITGNTVELIVRRPEDVEWTVIDRGVAPFAPPFDVIVYQHSKDPTQIKVRQEE